MVAKSDADAPGGPEQPVATLPQRTSVAPTRHWLGRRPKLTIALLALVPVIALVSIVAYKWKHHARPTFRTVVVVRADITERVTATGTLQPVIMSPVGAQVSGIVWKLHADYNSKVKAGDLLVELDPGLFENAVASATAQLAQAEANLTSAQAAALGARIIRDRTRIVEGKSLVSRADLDATVAIFGQTTGAARSSVALIALARAQLDRAKLDLEHSIIRSPVEGTVIARNIDVGQAVAATLTAPTLFTIAQDLHHMQVHAAVDEADIGEVHAAQEATFTVDAFREQVFPAVVNEVRNAPQTLSNVVTYDVVLDVTNPDLKLRPGMTANVLILIAQKTQVLAVPNEALRFRPVAEPSLSGMKVASTGAKPAAAVYVPQGRLSARIPIKVGITDGNMTEVEGLEPGREVIVDVARDKGKASPSGGAFHGG